MRRFRLVFTTAIGSALDPRNVTREFHALLTPAELPLVRFQDLHTQQQRYCSLRKWTRRPLWKRPAIRMTCLTLNTYSHVLPALQSEAVAKMDALLNR
jgi:hypothetical protein